MKMRIVALTLWVCVFLVSGVASGNNDDSIDRAIKLFQTAIKNDDATGFGRLADKGGFIVIRNFVSGGGGVRGKNIRNYYDHTSIPKGLDLQVQGETLVSLKALFSETVNTQDIPKYSIKNVKVIKVGKLQPPTAEIIDYCSDLLRVLDKKDDDSPQIIVLEDGLIGKEASLINGLPIGGWAVFEKVKNQYFIRGIFDFR